MPRKNKRKFFERKNSSKSKSAKLNEEDATRQQQQQQQSDKQLKQSQNNESDSEDEQEELNARQNVVADEREFRLRKSAVHSSISSVTNDSTIGHLELNTSPEVNVTKMGGTLSSSSTSLPSSPKATQRWCSEPNLNNNSAFMRRNQKATITLKVIQFIGEIPKETARDVKSIDDKISADVAAATAPNNNLQKYESTVSQKNDDNVQNKFITVREEDEQREEEVKPKEDENLHENLVSTGAVPKLDHYKEDEANEPTLVVEEAIFDDNYRVDSPKQQISSSSSSHEDENQNRLKRHAMLIQEISESSSSEEVKQFLDDKACAIEMKNIERIELTKDYRVDTPPTTEESSDEYNKIATTIDDDINETIIVQEICESSSNESVKNEIAKQQPQIGTLNLKIINIKDLPCDNSNTKLLTTMPGTSANAQQHSTQPKIKHFECKSEKKLNKAEEAIIEALYGNSNLLQIPNTPLDVISEEGSDCSDIERQNSASNLHSKNHKTSAIDDDYDEDDDVFLPTTATTNTSRYRNRIIKQHQQQRVAEQPVLINTKIIETESNVQESCKTWETKHSDSELQAELVYLPSTSSSATDLSERSDGTDTEEVEDTSEDTETNSMLENISVPSFHFNLEMTSTKQHEHDIDEVTALLQQQKHQSDYYQEFNEQKLPDILEEDEAEQSPRAILKIIESQQQIEDVNKELHHLVSTFNERSVREIKTKREEAKDEVVAIPNVHETNVIARNDNNNDDDDDNDDDKKLINEQGKEQEKSETPTPTHFRRKYSSDSSTSSSNSQCTIINANTNVYALKDLCMRSLNNEIKDKNNCEGKFTVQKKFNSLSRNAPNIPVINELELHYECDNSDDLQCREKDKVITILQVPPEINNGQSSCNNSSTAIDDKKRWYGMQSSQMPNLMVALSPSQKDYMMSSHDSNNTTSADVLLDMHRKFVERRAYHETEKYYNDDDDDDDASNKNSDGTSRFVNIKISPNEHQLEDSNQSNNNGCLKTPLCERDVESAIVTKSLTIIEDDESDKNSGNNNKSNLVSNSESFDENKSLNETTKKSAESDTIRMNTLKNLILREEFFKVNSNNNNNNDDEALAAAAAVRDDNKFQIKDEFKVKKYALESELRKLDSERKELEEELKNIQSLQHFKREEFLFNQKKLEENKIESQTIIETYHNQVSSSANDNNNVIKSNLSKYVNDDFTDFISSNEKLHKEIFNEWQDKVNERNERKLQKSLKITTTTTTTAIDEDDSREQEHSPLIHYRGRAASERIVRLNDEFLERVKERQKRLSLPLDDNLDASTESLLNDDNNDSSIEGITRKKKKKIFHFNNKENFPSHFREFIEYCEQEIAQSKNSVESGESMLKKPLCYGLIGVSLCLFGFYIGKYFLTKS